MELLTSRFFFFFHVSGEDFKVVQKEVSEILKGRILVGHAVHNDLKVGCSLPLSKLSLNTGFTVYICV